MTDQGENSHQQTDYCDNWGSINQRITLPFQEENGDIWGKSITFQLIKWKLMWEKVINQTTVNLGFLRDSKEKLVELRFPYK